ncbi:Transcription factor [Penicillium maclennaniae]|uniref:Transcription factor n=1 Tax=Penicillium maclennaniae TaxID=1343394 RepID=UPI00253FE95C|nr:Transcription factor [Penicillium maclennaniae]KAJ5682132.1 Transcription factor [Penicillium maclennaniae]
MSTKHGQKVDQGIMACLVQLYALWGQATEWLFEPSITSTLPPWQAGSTLSMLESKWMQFEIQFADTHRYINVDFKRRAREERQSHRYLSSWLCVQFLFHSIQCLLHRPFVTMIKLRHLKEHTGNQNPRIALLVNEEYRVDKVYELAARHQNYGSLFYNQDGFSGALSTMPTPSNLPRMSSSDEALMWDILDLTSSSSFNKPANTGRLTTHNAKTMTNGPDAPEQGSDDEDPTTGQEQVSVTPGFLAQDQELMGQASASRPLKEPSSDWLSSKQGGHNAVAAVPDIPDWMIFGDFTEHL